MFVNTISETIIAIGRANRSIIDPLLAKLPSAHYQQNAIEQIKSSLVA